MDPCVRGTAAVVANHARFPRVAHARVFGAHLLLAMLAVQLTLGILTLVHGVPLPLAALHQAGALLLFAAALNVAHAVR